jgi:hypothetical protein
MVYFIDKKVGESEKQKLWANQNLQQAKKSTLKCAK